MAASIELVKTFEDGTAEYRLCGGGVEAIIWSLGGVIQTLKVPNKEGEIADVVLGYDTPQEYLDGQMWIGGLIGRYGNRVADGKFTLDGVDYQLPLNVEPEGNNAHGGVIGFHKKYWSHEIVNGKLELCLTSPDGEEGFPGTVEVKVTYGLSENAELTVDYQATTDKPTIINLGNHAYWNLEGHNKGNIYSHAVKLSSSERTPMDERRIPYGDIIPVEDTVYDFREGKLLTEELLNSVYNSVMKGFDDNFVVPGEIGTKRTFGRFSAAGRVLEVSTTQPGYSFYTGYFIDSNNGKSGTQYNRYGAFIPFTQSFPDSPNKPDFPNVVLRPDETYNESTTYKFSTE